MQRPPINISHEDLTSDAVEGRLREQAAVRTTKEHYERAEVRSPTIAPPSGLRAWLLKSMLYLTLFGVVGATVGWLAGEVIAERPDHDADAARWVDELARIDRAENLGISSSAEAAKLRSRIRQIGAGNAIFRTKVGMSAPPAIAAAATGRPFVNDRSESFGTTLIALCYAGGCVALALSFADRVIERDLPGVAVNAAIGAVIGIGAGVAAAYVGEAATAALVAQVSGDGSLATRIGHATIVGAVFGSIIGLAPGVAARDRRRVAIGAIAGLLLGAAAAAAGEAAGTALGSAVAGRWLALALLGGGLGLAIGRFEEAAKQGWLRVAAGLIAGKQFILYRNPTFVGSAPMSHIYLFRDPQVGRRHAAIYQVAGGYEIENLPLGGATLVNDAPVVARQRLRRGDRIAIGRTTLVFDEKAAS